MDGSKRQVLFGRLIAAAVLTLAASQDVRADTGDVERFEANRAMLSTIAQSLSMKTDEDVVFAQDFEAGQAPACGADTDADRLQDCYETGTGQFVSATDTGTSPTVADTDGDGMLDGEEVLGTSGGLNLPALGVSPLRRDLLLEYDWFDTDLDCGAHSMRPSAGAIARVTAMFAAAPVGNPDGSTGINVIHDFGQGGVFAGGNRVQGHDAVLPGNLDATYYAIKQQNFDPRRLGYFHYVVMPHKYGGGINSSGYAEIIGDDMIVSLACSLDDAWVGNTIAHELGHNLGLDHGGDETCNSKPNYNSVMNYRYQFAGIDAQCQAQGSNAIADFSHGTRPVLDEAALDEPQGVCGAQPIDWNANGMLESGLSLDLNAGAQATCGAALSTLHDFDDWANLTFMGVLDKHGLLKTVQRETGCAGAPSPK